MCPEWWELRLRGSGNQAENDMHAPNHSPKPFPQSVTGRDEDTTIYSCPLSASHCTATFTFTGSFNLDDNLARYKDIFCEEKGIRKVTEPSDDAARSEPGSV